MAGSGAATVSGCFGCLRRPGAPIDRAQPTAWDADRQVQRRHVPGDPQIGMKAGAVRGSA